MGAGHDKGGQGASAFRAYLRALPDDIAAARDAGLPVVLERTSPLPAHAQRLMDTLGVEVRVTALGDERVARTTRGAHTEGHFAPIIRSTPAGAGPRADWIDYRASIARVFKREQNGDEALTCHDCGTETDVTDVVHSPRCSAIAGTLPRAAGDWDHDSVVAALREHARDGVAPAGADWYSKADDRPTYAIVTRVFGSWGAALEAAGLERPKRGRKTTARGEANRQVAEEEAEVLREIRARRDEERLEPSPPAEDDEAPAAPKRRGRPPLYSRDDVIAAIRTFHDDNDRLPTFEDQRMRRTGIPSESVIKRLFGSWADAVEAAGFGRPAQSVTRSPRSREFTRERIIELLQAEAADRGETPAANAWRTAEPGRPTESYVRKIFGSWNAAIAEAGLAVRSRGVQTSRGQQPPLVWAIKVPGTGLRYRTVEEAIVAAEEIEQDGERVAREARVQGDEGKADQAIDASRELAEKVRAAAAALDPPALEQPVDPVIPVVPVDLTLGLTLEQLTAAGGAIEAVASQLAHLDKPNRRAVWDFIRPLIEQALEC